MHELAKINNSCNYDLPKVSKVILTGNFNLHKVKLLSHLLKLIKVTSNLHDFGINLVT